MSRPLQDRVLYEFVYVTDEGVRMTTTIVAKESQDVLDWFKAYWGNAATLIEVTNLRHVNVLN